MNGLIRLLFIGLVLLVCGVGYLRWRSGGRDISIQQVPIPNIAGVKNKVQQSVKGFTSNPMIHDNLKAYLERSGMEISTVQPQPGGVHLLLRWPAGTADGGAQALQGAVAQGMIKSFSETGGRDRAIDVRYEGNKTFYVGRYDAVY